MKINYVGILHDPKWGESVAVYEVTFEVENNGVYATMKTEFKVSLPMIGIEDWDTRTGLTEEEIFRGAEMVNDELKTILKTL